MATMNMIQALNSALDVMMERDGDVVSFGEDAGYFGGVFRVTANLQKKYGLDRSFDAPINEAAIVAMAIGMAARGLKPLAEIQFADYIFPGLDQIVSELSRLRYRTAGTFTAPRSYILVNPSILTIDLPPFNTGDSLLRMGGRLLFVFMQYFPPIAEVRFM